MGVYWFLLFIMEWDQGFYIYSTAIVTSHMLENVGPGKAVKLALINLALRLLSVVLI